MKTREFIEKVEGLDYEIQKSDWAIEVWGKSAYKKYASIAKHNHKSVYIDTNDYALVKLCIEYAETPVSEREEVKLYRVELPDIERCNYGIVTVLRRDEDRVIIVKVHSDYADESPNCMLTESEIKRNHSYLWQFADEVKGI